MRFTNADIEDALSRYNGGSLAELARNIGYEGRHPSDPVKRRLVRLKGEEWVRQRFARSGHPRIEILDSMQICASLASYSGHALGEFARQIGYQGKNACVSARRRLTAMAQRGELVVEGKNRHTDWLQEKFPIANWPKTNAR